MCGNHNHNSKNSKSMMWMMIPCLLLIGVLFLGGGKLSGGGYLWPILVGVFVVTHVWMMFKGHGSHDKSETENKIDDALAKQSDAKDMK